MQLLRRRARGERGAVALEFAFVLPMVMMFFIGSAQVGLAVLASASGTNAAREAARVATVRYECADNHVSARCPFNPSTNYNFIKAAALAKLGGVVQAGSFTVSVQCRAGGATGAVVLCEKNIATPDTDVVVVTVGWRDLATTRFVPLVSHSATAVMAIGGRPDLASLAPEPDLYPPALTTTDGAVATDSDSDGDIDTVKLTFDEDITQSVTSSLFTLSGSPSGSNTITSATVSGRVVTITMTGSTKNTSTSGFTISLAASAQGITDATGNQATFTNTAITDKAGPRLISITDTNGLINGRMEALDTVIFTFSEPIGIGLGVTTVTETDPSGSDNDTVQIAGITSGPMVTNSNGYISTNASSVAVVGLAAAVGNTLVVTITAPLTCTPTLCTGLGTGSDSSPFTITIASTLADVLGNAASGSGTISNIF